ncbi:MAG: Ig-like domain-containing protein [Saprospiraceae bacterium]|nr:hypothetical protein [Bacteroidia bacterium]NNF22801.1 Ig-like domain-containing protein [Saprospiraceae bacterium]NNK90387.1 Ig-like domain-containing protein [Saprospiraceae bacterium]
MYKSTLLFFILTSLFFIACSSNDGPTMEIQSPADGSIYAQGDSISITGVATDDVAVTRIDLLIESDNAPDQQQEIDISTASNLTEIFFQLGLLLDPNVTTGPYEFTLTFTAYDEDGQSDDDSVSLKVE